MEGKEYKHMNTLEQTARPHKDQSVIVVVNEVNK